MSYFPPPYSPPPEAQPDWFPPFSSPDLQRCARQASVLMFVLCGLALLAALMFLMASTMPLEQFPAQTREQLEQTASQSGWSPQTSLRAMALLLSIPGVVVGVLGLFVRGGRMTAIFTAIVLDGLMLAAMAIATIGALFGASGGLLASCPFLGAGGLMAFLMVRLIAAAKAARVAGADVARQQLQYWQNYQWDQNSGYGYNAGLPPTQERKEPGNR